MLDLTHFKQTYLLQDSEFVIVPFGSRIYGTHKDNSDYDFIAVVKDHKDVVTGTEYHYNNIDIQIHKWANFREQLTLHKIHALEACFKSPELKRLFPLELSLSTLRESLSEKASNSFVKAKKKIEVEKDFYIGWKSLFHSLRILNFGIQIAATGSIENYAAANQYWTDILEAQQYNWEYFKEMYQPEYNRLATEFRKLAPKA